MTTRLLYHEPHPADSLEMQIHTPVCPFRLVSLRSLPHPPCDPLFFLSMSWI